MMALSAAALAQAATVPYASDMCEDEAWTVLDSNDDGVTWNDLYDDYDIKDSGFEYGKWYKYSRQNDADDWLISPAITLEAGKTYTVSFWTCARSEWEGFSLAMASGNTADALSAGTTLYEYPTGDYDKATTDCQKIVCSVTPATAGDYYFGFHATSEADGSGICLTGFDVREFAFNPAPVSDVKAIPAVDGAISCTVSWTLPTTDANGQPLPADKAIEKVALYRDGNLLKELAKDATSYTDTEATGLTAGFHTYGVAVTIGGITTETVETRSGYIGKVEAAALPWNVNASDLTEDDFAAFWNVVKGENSTIPAGYGWQLKKDYLRFDPRSKNNVEDDWLVTPRINFAEPGIYRFKINAQYTASPDPVMIDLYIGENRTPSAADKKLGQFTTVPAEAGDIWVAFRVAEKGEYYLSLHCCREELQSAKPIDIYSMAVESWKELPLNISNLAVENTETTATLTWRNPSLNNLGETITALDRIEIMRDGTVIATLKENITPGETMTYTDTPDHGGIFSYSVEPFMSGDAAPESAAESVTTGWIGDKTRTLPYTVDFSESPSMVELNALWNIENNDNDEFQWTISGNSFTLQLNADGGTSHDALITPPFKLEEEHEYEITISATGAQEEFPLIAEIRPEIAQPAEGKVIRKEGDVANNQIILKGSDTAETYSVKLVPAAKGVARMALATNPEYEYSMDLDPLRIRRIQIEDLGIPSNVTTIIEEASEAEYYDLTGIRVSKPVKGNIYIRVSKNGESDRVRF